METNNHKYGNNHFANTPLVETSVERMFMLDHKSMKKVDDSFLMKLSTNYDVEET
jgi:hypothetical protein